MSFLELNELVHEQVASFLTPTEILHSIGLANKQVRSMYKKGIKSLRIKLGSRPRNHAAIRNCIRPMCLSHLCMEVSVLPVVFRALGNNIMSICSLKIGGSKNHDNNLKYISSVMRDGLLSQLHVLHLPCNVASTPVLSILSDPYVCPRIQDLQLSITRDSSNILDDFFKKRWHHVARRSAFLTRLHIRVNGPENIHILIKACNHQIMWLLQDIRIEVFDNSLDVSSLLEALCDKNVPFLTKMAICGGIINPPLRRIHTLAHHLIKIQSLELPDIINPIFRDTIWEVCAPHWSTIPTIFRYEPTRILRAVHNGLITMLQGLDLDLDLDGITVHQVIEAMADNKILCESLQFLSLRFNVSCNMQPELLDHLLSYTRLKSINLSLWNVQWTMKSSGGIARTSHLNIRFLHRTGQDMAFISFLKNNCTLVQNLFLKIVYLSEDNPIISWLLDCNHLQKLDVVYGANTFSTREKYSTAKIININVDPSSSMDSIRGLIQPIISTLAEMHFVDYPEAKPQESSIGGTMVNKLEVINARDVHIMLNGATRYISSYNIPYYMFISDHLTSLHLHLESVAIVGSMLQRGGLPMLEILRLRKLPSVLYPHENADMIWRALASSKRRCGMIRTLSITGCGVSNEGLTALMKVIKGGPVYSDLAVLEMGDLHPQHMTDVLMAMKKTELRLSVLYLHNLDETGMSTLLSMVKENTDFVKHLQRLRLYRPPTNWKKYFNKLEKKKLVMLQ